MNKSLKPERQDMKISKIFLFTAAALALCGACDDSDDKGGSFDYRRQDFRFADGRRRGEQGRRCLDHGYQLGRVDARRRRERLCAPSAVKGKDGDIVAFTVKANDKEEDQVFTYTFTCGKKTASFQDYA